jgi:hypothetical protein
VNAREVIFTKPGDVGSPWNMFRQDLEEYLSTRDIMFFAARAREFLERHTELYTDTVKSYYTHLTGVYKVTLRSNPVICAYINAETNLMSCGVNIPDLVRKAAVYNSLCKTVAKLTRQEFNPRLQDPDIAGSEYVSTKQNENWGSELDVCAQDSEQQWNCEHWD